MSGPTLTAIEWDGFFTVLEKAIVNWAVEVRNPEGEPVELLVLEVTRTEDGEPALVGRTWSDSRQDWLGDETRVLLDDDVNVVIL